jgi:cytochrome c oxidase subunit III
MTGEVVMDKSTRSINPQRFGMWLFLVASGMMFLSLSSAYIVKKSFGDWVYVDFPDLFKYTSIIIVLSSISMQFAYISAKRNNLGNVKAGLVVTGLLAVFFVLGQWMAWGDLVDNNFHLVGNPASSFVYIFTGLHVAHLAGALIFLGIVLAQSFNFKVHSKSMLRIEMCTTFWHFLGGLWLYLYLFLIFNN